MKRKTAMTVDRVLSRFGIASRTEARQAIAAGRVKVNGRVVRDPGLWVEPGKDVLHLDGSKVRGSEACTWSCTSPKE